MKKILSTLLVAAMTLSLVPAFSAFAAESVDVVSQPRYELEDAELKATGDNYVKNGNDATVSGGKFVRAFDNGEQSVTVKVNAPYAGYYELSVGVITMEASRDFDVIVNGKTYENVVCGVSGGSWDGDTKVRTLVVALEKGENTVVLTQDVGFGPSMDYIEFAEVDMPDELCLVPGTATKIEAEDAYYINGVKVTDSDAASGGKRVESIGENEGSVAKYAEYLVNAPADGEATLVIYYFAGMDRAMEISVNGEATTYQFANNGTWGNAGDSAATAADAITITLKEGVNSIKFYNSTGWGPNLDYIEVTAAEIEDDGGDETDPPVGGGDETDPPVGGGDETDPPVGGGDETDPPKTGDAAVYAGIVVVVALVGTAIAVSKKRQTAE